MNKLLKLSNVAINVSHISMIHITKNKYTIHLNNFRNNIFNTSHTIIEVKSDNNPDYFRISEYILKHTM